MSLRLLLGEISPVRENIINRDFLAAARMRSGSPTVTERPSNDGLFQGVSTRSRAAVPDIRGYDGANGGKAPMSCLTVADMPTSAQADQLPSTLLDSVAASGVLQTLECLTVSTSDRRFLAVLRPPLASRRYHFAIHATHRAFANAERDTFQRRLKCECRKQMRPAARSASLAGLDDRHGKTCSCECARGGH